MSEPKTRDEYFQRMRKNTRIEGKGPDVVVHMACPACAEPDFLVCRAALMIEAGAAGAACGACGRRMHTEHEGVITSVVLDSGAPLPEWVPARKA